MYLSLRGGLGVECRQNYITQIVLLEGYMNTHGTVYANEVLWDAFLKLIRSEKALIIIMNLYLIISVRSSIGFDIWFPSS
jgi:hypothetical protein